MDEGKRTVAGTEILLNKNLNFKNKNILRLVWALQTIRWKMADKQNVDELDFSRKAQKWQVQACPEYFVALY